jgi:hypothetical protein
VARAVALAEAEVERIEQIEQIEQEGPLPSAAPDRLVVSVDGAMVPLRQGAWAEMKLLSMGEPEVISRAADGAAVDGAAVDGAAVRTRHLSYFARLSDAETFGRQALGELHRRGLERAGAVAAVQDGAVWLHGFMDFHRPDALRILDWAHAAQRLTASAEHFFGVGTPRSRRAGSRLRHWLWSEGPQRVLAVLACWPSWRAGNASSRPWAPMWRICASGRRNSPTPPFASKGGRWAAAQRRVRTRP